MTVSLKPTRDIVMHTGVLIWAQTPEAMCLESEVSLGLGKMVTLSVASGSLLGFLLWQVWPPSSPYGCYRELI